MAKIKQEFWATIFRYEPFRLGPSPTAKYSGAMFFPYRYKVQGSDVKQFSPSWTPLRISGSKLDPYFKYDLFAYRLGGKWHLHEKTTGVIVSEGRTVGDAMHSFEMKLGELSRERLKNGNNYPPQFLDQIAEMGSSHRFPEIETQEAFRLILRKEEERKAARRIKKEEKLQLECSVGKTTMEPFQPRES